MGIASIENPAQEYGNCTRWLREDYGNYCRTTGARLKSSRVRKLPKN